MAWRFGSMHSQVRWVCSYLGVMTVAGFFKEARATLRLDGQDASQWSVEATIPAASLESGNTLRDDVLRGADFFDVDRFPVITFSSKRVARAEGRYRVLGDLTVHGVTREIVLDLQDLGEAVDWLGQRSRVLLAETTLKRTDFQVGPPPQAGALIGSNVRVSLQVELLWVHADAARGEPHRSDAVARALDVAAA